MKKLLLSLVVLLALFSTACGSSSTTDTAAGEGDAESSETSAEDAWLNRDSPLDDFLGIDYSDFNSEDQQAEFEEQEREAQAAIATCMTELGWEYTPVDSSGMIVMDAFADEGPEYGSDEWVELYALGITTQSFSQSEVGPDLVGYDDSQFEAMDESMDEDPNFTYQQSLSEAEQIAYEEDLWGEQPEWDETLTDEEQEALWQDWEPTGCQAAAWESMEDSWPGQEFYMEFGDELDDMYERVSSDPRIVAEQTKLVDCLAESGHSFVADKNPWEQFYELFEGELEPIYESAYSSFEDPFDGVDPATLSEEEIEAMFEEMESTQATQFDDATLAIIADLQEREFALAADVLACEPNFFAGGGESEIYFDVLAEYEREFLDANADALAGFEGSGAE